MQYLNLSGRHGLTLGIEEHSVLDEVWPFEHTPEFRNLLLSVWSHCTDKRLAHCNIRLLLDTHIACRRQ